MKVSASLIVAAWLFASAASTFVEDAFYNNQLVPYVLNAAPNNLLNVVYNGVYDVNLGNVLSPVQIQNKPYLSWQPEYGAYYTLVLAGASGQNYVNNHWLVGNIPGNAIEQGEELVQYGGFPPVQGLGNNYVFLLFKQPNGKIFFDKNFQPNQYSVLDLSNQYGFDAPNYGNFFYLANTNEYY